MAEEEIEERHTWDHWKKWWKETWNVTEFEVEKIEELWELITPKERHEDLELFAQTRKMGSVAVQYTLHCLKCDRYIHNGWYQLKCFCGNNLPNGFVYP